MTKYWGQDIQDFVTSVYLMVGGFKDGLCIWRQVPWIMSNYRIASIFTWICMASVGMCLALWLMLDKVVDPITSCAPDIFGAYVTGSKTKDEIELEELWKALKSLALLIPVLAVCSKATNRWYQKLSDCIFVEVKKLDADVLVKPQAKGETNYCDTMSLISTVYTNILVGLVPLVIDLVEHGLANTLGLVMPRTVHLLIDLLRKYATYTGLLYQSMLYSWLPYNFHWITAGLGAGTRFDVVERRWEYFLGFGLPVVLFMRAFTWMPLSFGVYFLFMPFMVVASNTTEYSRGYKYLAAKVEYIAGPDFDPSTLVGLEKLFAVFLHRTESRHQYDSPSTKSRDPSRKQRQPTRFHLGRYYSRIRAFYWPHLTTVYLMKAMGVEGHDVEAPSIQTSPGSSGKRKKA